MIAAVSLRDLSKRYGDTEAVNGLSFEVGPGQIFGLLGPNGAGKTTTLECILGLREPDRGSILIHGVDVRAHPIEAKRFAGAQLQGAALQDKITPREALDLFAAFYYESIATGDLLARFDLDSKADAPFVTLSGGQRQRLFLALALVNRPKLLVLDEPTAGLDPQTRRTLRSLIRAMRDEGRTVLLSTHDLDEADQLCDQVAIMDRGRIVATAPPAELIRRAGALARVVVRTTPPLPRTVIDSLGDVQRAAHDDSGWALDTTAPNRLIADLARCADEARVELLDIELRQPSLEDAFIELTGHPWSSGDERGAAG
jgi:ABC-2 type transport system ATP-binding protein